MPQLGCALGMENFFSIDNAECASIHSPFMARRSEEATAMVCKFFLVQRRHSIVLQISSKEGGSGSFVVLFVVPFPRRGERFSK